MRMVTRRLRWMAAGAMVGWFTDPARGDDRRARARSAATSWGRGTRRIAEGLSGWLPSRARVRVGRVLARIPGAGRVADQRLRRQIERDVLHPAGASALAVEVHGGRVLVRGAVATVETAGGLADRIHRVPDVISVEFHLQGAADDRAAA